MEWQVVQSALSVELPLQVAGDGLATGLEMGFREVGGATSLLELNLKDCGLNP